MFENVTYTFYSDTLGRAIVPSEADFCRYALDNQLFMQRLIDDGIVTEKMENGIDTAVCRMIEIDFLQAEEMSGEAESNTEGAAIASESINGYSYSYDRTAQQESIKLNAKSSAAKKIDIIKLYTDYNPGVA